MIHNIYFSIFTCLCWLWVVYEVHKILDICYHCSVTDDEGLPAFKATPWTPVKRSLKASGMSFFWGCLCPGSWYIHRRTASCFFLAFSVKNASCTETMTKGRHLNCHILTDTSKSLISQISQKYWNIGTHQHLNVYSTFCSLRRCPD